MASQSALCRGRSRSPARTSRCTFFTTDVTDRCARDVLARLPMEFINAAARCYTGIATDGKLRSGSICTGSGMGELVTDQVCRVIREFSGLPLEHDLQFVCECDSRKIAHLSRAESIVPSHALTSDVLST